MGVRGWHQCLSILRDLFVWDLQLVPGDLGARMARILMLIHTKLTFDSSFSFSHAGRVSTSMTSLFSSFLFVPLYCDHKILAYAPVVVEWMLRNLPRFCPLTAFQYSLEGVASCFFWLLLHVVYPVGTGVVFLEVRTDVYPRVGFFEALPAGYLGTCCLFL